MKPLYLASSSPRRQSLIKSLGLKVEIIKNDVDETIDLSQHPSEVVIQLAERKAVAAADKLEDQDGIVIGGDTVVVFENKILGKPKDEEEAFKFLTRLQGNTHEVYSGLASIDLETQQRIVNFRKTSVTMKSLTDEKVRNYIKTGEPMDKAGAYAIQGIGATLVEAIEGDYFNVVGLSLSLLSDMLEQLNVKII